MKKRILICFMLFVCLQVNAQWKQKKFIIGTFYDPKIASQRLNDTAGYVDKIRTVKEANFNLLSGMDGYYDKDFIDYKLGVISSAGLQTLLMNPVSWGKGNSTFNPTQATQWFDFIGNLSSNKQAAIYGYSIFDEPAVSRAKDVKTWVSYAKKRTPDKLAYVNLLPSYVFKTRDEYEAYLDTYLSSSGPDKLDVVSYDFYPFIQGGIKPDYFYNLYILDKKTQGRPFWYFALTTKHREYIEVGDYEINFMVFAPLIYGAKGILYFTYETITGSSMPFGDAIIASNNKPTSKYYTIKSINGFLRDVWGPIVMNSEKTGTYHMSQNPYNQSLQNSEIVNSNTPFIAGISDKNIAVGIFRSLKNPGEYNLLLFNKSSSSVNTVVSLKGSYNNVSVSVPYKKYASSKNAFEKQNAQTANNITKININFAPGEGRILKLTNVTTNQ